MTAETTPGDAEHPSIAYFRSELTRLGGTGRIVVLPDSVHTAALAAQSLGCEVGAIANSLLFAATTDAGTTEPVLVLTSGAHRVDVDLVAATIGVRSLKRARPDFVKATTGQVIGGVSPIAHPAPIPTYLDRSLARYDLLWAAAGHPAAVFSTDYPELRALTGATELDAN
ncbi:MAG: YbaK/EbsC family protein [Propionibacteriales bacterium]|nr:YbaK/EbsC family protein [Propionibacteriales bacterium]